MGSRLHTPTEQGSTEEECHWHAGSTLCPLHFAPQLVHSCLQGSALCSRVYLHHGWCKVGVFFCEVCSDMWWEICTLLCSVWEWGFLFLFQSKPRAVPDRDWHWFLQLSKAVCWVCYLHTVLGYAGGCCSVTEDQNRVCITFAEAAKYSALYKPTPSLHAEHPVTNVQLVTISAIRDSPLLCSRRMLPTVWDHIFLFSSPAFLCYSCNFILKAFLSPVKG